MANRSFGDIPGFPVGSSFGSRIELSKSGVHRQSQAGITGTPSEGAESVVVSGGYEDDEDHGDEIVYTGHGSRDQATGKQISDQTLTLGNLALAFNQIQGIPVRVIRGSNRHSAYAPMSGYRYDGLFRVEDHWREPGKAGFLVWRFRLVRLDGGPISPNKEFTGPPRRERSVVLRIVRDTKASRSVKHIHDYKCQVCGLRLETTVGPYAEGAHIRPLGRPHNGPDDSNNILCLCPNHHVLFDLGAFSIGNELELIGLNGKLRTEPTHVVSSEHLEYHREHYLNAVKADSQ